MFINDRSMIVIIIYQHSILCLFKISPTAQSLRGDQHLHQPRGASDASHAPRQLRWQPLGPGDHQA